MSKVILILMMILLISTASPIQTSSPFHIFLSFRGNDTRNDFATLIYSALSLAGFNVFKDDVCICAGHPIKLVIRKEIERSLGAVIIFSPDFPSSEYCLDELAQIVDRKEELKTGYVLQPIYVNGLRTHHVEGLTGSFGQAFSEHDKYPFWDWKKRRMVKRWRDALRKVLKYRGKVYKDGKMDVFIKEVVVEIRDEFLKLGVRVKQRPYLTEGNNHNLEPRFESIEKSADRLEPRFESIKKPAAFLKFLNIASREDVGIICISMISFIALQKTMIKIFDNFLCTPVQGNKRSARPAVSSPFDRRLSAFLLRD